MTALQFAVNYTAKYMRDSRAVFWNLHVQPKNPHFRILDTAALSVDE
jgi:hypothetical protein